MNKDVAPDPLNLEAPVEATAPLVDKRSLEPLELETAATAAAAEATAERQECQTLALNCAGTCFVIAAFSTFWHLLLDSFEQPWLWPYLGLFFLMGHLLLLLAHCHAQRPKDVAFRLSCSALVCEVVAYFALATPYLCPSFIVPFWWWQATVLVLLWPAMVLLIVVIALRSCCTYCGDPDAPDAPAHLAADAPADAKKDRSAQLSQWSHGVALLGMVLLAWTCFALASLVLFAGGTMVRDHILSILPDETIPPGAPGGVQVVSSNATTVWQNPICDMKEENCSLSDFPMYSWTAIRPGGETKCLLGEYAFRVYRGDPSKVLILFDGGGSCWNWATFVVALCSPAVYFAHSGIHNVTDPANPYHGYTVIEIVYCSGDVFAGTSTHFWIMPAQTASAWKPMRGYANTLAVLEWTKAQFEGSEPALHSLKGFYREKDTMFIADSFNGLQVKGSAAESGVMAFWGVCDTGLVPPELQERCYKKELGINHIVLHNLKTYPNVRLLMLASKFDAIQILFADLVEAFNSLWAIVYSLFSGSTHKIIEKWFWGGDFYRNLTRELTLYAAYPNFAVFLVNSDFHGFLNLRMYEMNLTTPKGTMAGCSDPEDGDRLLSWLSVEVSQTNQCFDAQNDTVEPWTGDFCNASIHWSPGRC